MVKVYILNDHDEYGPENVRVSLSHEGIRRALQKRLDEDWPVGRAREGYREQCVAKMNELLATDDLCEKRNLGDGWGGLQLSIVEAD